MNKRIIFRNMPHSDPMEDYANKQLAKIEKFLTNEPSPVNIELVLQPSKVHEHHHIELRVKSKNYDLVSDHEHEGDDFYDTLDRVIDVMYRRILQEKERRIDERKSRGRHDDFKKER